MVDDKLIRMKYYVCWVWFARGLEIRVGCSCSLRLSLVHIASVTHSSATLPTGLRHPATLNVLYTPSTSTNNQQPYPCTSLLFHNFNFTSLSTPLASCFLFLVSSLGIWIYLYPHMCVYVCRMMVEALQNNEVVEGHNFFCLYFALLYGSVCAGGKCIQPNLQVDTHRAPTWLNGCMDEWAGVERGHAHCTHGCVDLHERGDVKTQGDQSQTVAKRGHLGYTYWGGCLCGGLQSLAHICVQPCLVTERKKFIKWKPMLYYRGICPEQRSKL